MNGDDAHDPRSHVRLIAPIHCTSSSSRKHVYRPTGRRIRRRRVMDPNHRLSAPWQLAKLVLDAVLDKPSIPPGQTGKKVSPMSGCSPSQAMPSSRRRRSSARSSRLPDAFVEIVISRAKNQRVRQTSARILHDDIWRGNRPRSDVEASPQRYKTTAAPREQAVKLRQ